MCSFACFGDVCASLGAVCVALSGLVVCVGCKGNWGTARSENEVGEEMRGAHVASATGEAHAGTVIQIVGGGSLVERVMRIGLGALV